MQDNCIKTKKIKKWLSDPCKNRSISTTLIHFKLNIHFCKVESMMKNFVGFVFAIFAKFLTESRKHFRKCQLKFSRKILEVSWFSYKLSSINFNYFHISNSSIVDHPPYNYFFEIRGKFTCTMSSSAQHRNRSCHNL